MTDRAGAILRSAAWIAFLALSLAALHRLGDSMPLASTGATPPDTWPGERDPVSMLVGVGRLAALAIGWYLLVATLLMVATRLVGWGRAASAVEAVVPRIVRRALHGAVGLSLVAAPAPALASPHLPVPLIVPAEAAPGTGGDADPITMHRLPDEPPAPDPSPTPAPPPAGRTWTIAPGDHLWSIAERVLEEHVGRPPTAREVDPYWRTLIEVNRPRLARPDVPDLVHPGQVFDVPPPPPTGV